VEYILTEHAQQALVRRQIPLEWLERVLNAPEATEADPLDPELEHRLARISELEHRVLRVIVNHRTTPPRVVTAFFDRRRTLP
jgi:hypothetical protein